MDINTESSPSVPKTKIPLALVTLIIMLVVLASGGVYYFYKQNTLITAGYQKVKSAYDECISTKANQAKTNDSINNAPVKTEKRLLTTKEIDGVKINTYRLPDNLTGTVFEVKPDEGRYPFSIYSFSDEAFSEDRLIEVVNNNLWVVNSQTNKIDIYTFHTTKDNIGRINYAYFQYKDSLELPNYETGALYGIKCDTSTCKVFTAFHQESGCNMTLDIKSGAFSDIECIGPRGDKIELEKRL